MPFYEYQCESCAHELEALQKISEEPLVYCPECGTDSLKKKISASAFVLKGSGWYETDFKNGDKKKDKETKDLDSKSDDKTSDKSSDKKDTKADKDSGAKKENKSTDSASSKPTRNPGKKSSDSTGASANA